MIDRADRTGLVIAVTGHLAIIGILSLGWLVVTKRPFTVPPAVEIEIVNRVAAHDMAPEVSPTPPAASVAPVVGPPDEATPAETAPVVTPPTKARPHVEPATAKPDVRPKPAAARPIAPQNTASSMPQKQSRSDAPVRGSRLGKDFLQGITDRATASLSITPRAEVGVQAYNSISRRVREQIKPFWKAPTGADAELLRTELSISLSPAGQVTEVHVVRTTGQTESNQAQIKLHQEAAIKAVRLAAPFNLPSELYSDWRLLEPVSFDKRLSQ